jgi:hypothetical protein
MMAFSLSICKLEDLHQLFSQNGVFQKRCTDISLLNLIQSRMDILYQTGLDNQFTPYITRICSAVEPILRDKSYSLAICLINISQYLQAEKKE